MLKEHSQLKLPLSPYQGIYDAIIPADHLLRKIKENIDFSFVNPMLRKQYCENFGRPAKEPEMMFKPIKMPLNYRKNFLKGHHWKPDWKKRSHIQRSCSRL